MHPEWEQVTEPAHCRGGPKDCGKGADSVASKHWQTYHSSQRLFFERWYFKPLPIPQVLEEGDIDDDKKLSINEFTHVINKAPDFLTTFNIRI